MDKALQDAFDSAVESRMKDYRTSLASKGGKARAAKLTPERRTQIAIGARAARKSRKSVK